MINILWMSLRFGITVTQPLQFTQHFPSTKPLWGFSSSYKLSDMLAQPIEGAGLAYV
jgi:hypothetical protein